MEMKFSPWLQPCPCQPQDRTQQELSGMEPGVSDATLPSSLLCGFTGGIWFFLKSPDALWGGFKTPTFFQAQALCPIMGQPCLESLSVRRWMSKWATYLMWNTLAPELPCGPRQHGKCLLLDPSTCVPFPLSAYPRSDYKGHFSASTALRKAQRVSGSWEIFHAFRPSTSCPLKVLMGTIIWRCLKKWNGEPLSDLGIPLARIYPKDLKAETQNTCISVFIIVLFIIAKGWSQAYNKRWINKQNFTW